MFKNNCRSNEFEKINFNSFINVVINQFIKNDDDDMMMIDGYN